VFDRIVVHSVSKSDGASQITAELIDAAGNKPC
jgi:hypothetical protein